MRKSSASFRRLMSKTAAKYRPKISGEFSVSLIIFSCTLLLDARRLKGKVAKKTEAHSLLYMREKE